MENNLNTRHTLLKRAQDPNDQQAWNDFVKYYKPFISGTIRRKCSLPQEYDDLTQDILVSIWESLGNFKYQPQPGSFRRWLSQLIRFKVIDYVRKQSRYSGRQETALNHEVIARELSETEFERTKLIDRLETWLYQLTMKEPLVP